MSRMLQDPLCSAYYQDIPSAVHTIKMFLIKTTRTQSSCVPRHRDTNIYFKMQSRKLTENTNQIRSRISQESCLFSRRFE